MKKLVKPEINFVEFDAQDVITASLGNTYDMVSGQYTNSEDTAMVTTEYGGLNWNVNQ